MFESRFKKEGIPWDDRAVKDVKASSLHLTELFLDRVLHEVERIKGAPNQEGRIYTLLVSGVRFAFRCHQFADGMNEPSLAKFEEVSQLMAKSRPEAGLWLDSKKSTQALVEVAEDVVWAGPSM